MRRPLLLLRLSLAVVLSAEVLAQNLVPIQFQTDPVYVQTGTGIVFTVLTTPQILSMTWQYQGVTLGLWAGGNSVVNPVPQFLGRVTITATQLQIGSAKLQDAGNYTVIVTPMVTTGLATNSKSIQLGVFDAVAGVSLAVPSLAIEGGNVSLSCTWTAGTQLTVQWGKNGAAIAASSRITISGGSLLIDPSQRGDAGKYTCTVSNPVSAQTASQTLTVYYGPDTPVLTKQTPNQNQNACVGGGDVLVGQTVGLTCSSSSLPPALYSWQYNGQPVTSSQSASGVLTLQTYSTNQSGQYFCTARNSITGNTSTQGTALAIVGTCLNVGQVVGIVIGSLLLILIIVLLIVLIVFCTRKRREPPRAGGTVVVQKTNPQTRPQDPQSNGVKELGQGPNPPLYNSNTRQPQHFYTTLPGHGGNPQTLRLNSQQNSNTRRHNGPLHNAIQTTNSYPHNGTDNPAFVHTDVHNANPPQQNPNILIQTGTAQGGAQLPAVHVNLTTLPQTAQNSNGQMPTIHFNLNSYPTNDRAQQDSSLPPTNAVNNHASQTQLDPINVHESNLQFSPGDPRGNGHTDAGRLHLPRLSPTGNTHNNSSGRSQRNANTQTYQQETHRSSSDRTSGRHSAALNSSRQQMSWDLLRGTPSYPSGTLQTGHLPLQRGQVPSEDVSSDGTDYTTTDYTIHPPIREGTMTSRSQPQSRGRAADRSRALTRRDGPSVDRQARSRSADSLNLNPHSVTQFEAAHRTQRNHSAQRESAQRDIRGLIGSQTAPRQETTHSNNPQALPLVSQQASVEWSAVSQGPTKQQGPTSSWGADTRALADPNHLPQAHMAQQQRAARIQTSPQGLGTQTQLVTHDASQLLQGGNVPILQASARPNPSNLTQAALEAHTKRAQMFQNRKQQTQAALLHPETQARAPVAGVQHPPTPPPAIALEEFQTLPKERSTRHTSPAQGRHPPNVQHHHSIMPPAHHHQPAKGHMHVIANRRSHAPGHAHPAHFTHHQQQARRGRPR